MSESWQNAFHGGFAFGTAPFAVHPSDEARAKQFLHLAKAQGVTLEEVVTEARAYLEAQGCRRERIERQLEYVWQFCGSLS